MKNFHPILPILLSFFISSTLHAQTFNGIGNLPVPPGAPASTVGTTTSSVTVTNVGVLSGCTSIDNVTIDLVHTWVGDTDGQLVIENISGGNGPYELSLNGQTPVFIIDFPFTFFELPHGNYEVNVVDAIGLSTSLSLFIPEPEPVTLELTEDIALDLGEDVVLNAETNINPVTINWQPETNLDCIDCLEPTVLQPTENIRYTLTIADENGCTTNNSIQLFISKGRNVYVPNAFSPDRDGINDRVTVFAGEDVVNIQRFRIFDRWGNTIFENANFAPNDIDAGWMASTEG